MTGVNESVRELIQRRRLQLLIHSCIYYEYNESLVTDEQWKNWAVEFRKTVLLCNKSQPFLIRLRTEQSV